MVEASAASRRRRTLLQSQPIQLLSQVHAPQDAVAGVQPKVAASVEDGSLAAALQGIGLTLVQDSGERRRRQVGGCFFFHGRHAGSARTRQKELYHSMPPSCLAQHAPRLSVPRRLPPAPAVTYGTPGTPPPPPPAPPADDGGGSNVVAIVVPIVCVVAALAVAAVGVVWYMKKKKGRQAQADVAAAQQERRTSRRYSQPARAAPAVVATAAPSGHSSGSGLAAFERANL